MSAHVQRSISLDKEQTKAAATGKAETHPSVRVPGSNTIIVPTKSMSLKGQELAAPPTATAKMKPGDHRPDRWWAAGGF